MKSVFILLSLLFFSCEMKMSTGPDENHSETVEKSTDDLRKKYQADEYGMHQYVMAFLYSSDQKETDSTKAAELQNAHMDNISRLAEEGKLVLAGPFLDEGDLRGIYIFDVKTIEEAKALCATDPAIKSGQLRMDLKPWYGSAALMGVNELHGKLKLKSPTD